MSGSPERSMADGPGYDGEPSGQLSSPSSRSHGHLWRLSDGTGLHAPAGVLVRDAEGQVCCHLCGRWFAGLAWHVHTHGYTADEYREMIGLCRGEPLVGEPISTRISRRQAAAYRRSEKVRERFRPGQEMARSGALGDVARASLAAASSRQRVTVRRAALDRGRATRARRREDDLAGRLAELGWPDGVTALPAYLRHAYADGASLESLARTTGLGRGRLRVALRDAGVAVRATGQNSVGGRRSRAVMADDAAAAAVGTDDLVGWLRCRHEQGWSLSRLGRAVGHSAHWVRWRLEASPVQSVQLDARAGLGP